MSPCKDCTERVLGCHSTCEKYLAYRKKRDEIIEARAKDTRDYYDIMYSHRFINAKKKR